MTYQPLVSIIINTHNGVEYLREAIDSAYSQTYSNIEVIVYDNASSVDVQSYLEGYNNIQFYRSEIYLTLGQARNEALKLAKGELIDYLDCDDLFLPEKLEKQVPLFEESRVGLVICNTWFFKQDGAGIEEWLYYDQPPPTGHVFNELLINYYISFETAIFRKSAVGNDPKKWFPENFNICTDFDLFLRISHKFMLAYVDEPLAKWRIHEANLSTLKNYLAPLEKLAMIPRILDYEPDFYKKNKKELKRYLASVFSEQATFYWQQEQKFEAIWSQLHSLFKEFSFKSLTKLLLICGTGYQKISQTKTRLEAFKRRTISKTK
jgi:glycosyltransferase involved in cell wall biosynthesis